MKCKVKIKSTDKREKGSTTVVVFVVQVGSNPKKEAKKFPGGVMTIIFAFIRKINSNLT